MQEEIKAFTLLFPNKAWYQCYIPVVVSSKAVMGSFDNWNSHYWYLNDSQIYRVVGMQHWIWKKTELPESCSLIKPKGCWSFELINCFSNVISSCSPLAYICSSLTYGNQMIKHSYLIQIIYRTTCSYNKQTLVIYPLEDTPSKILHWC